MKINSDTTDFEIDRLAVPGIYDNTEIKTRVRKQGENIVRRCNRRASASTVMVREHHIFFGSNRFPGGARHPSPHPMGSPAKEQ